MFITGTMVKKCGPLTKIAGKSFVTQREGFTLTFTFTVISVSVEDRGRGWAMGRRKRNSTNNNQQ